MGVDVDGIGFGITPAYAGKSAFSLLMTGQPKDHPRVCGEKKKGRDQAASNSGSPPRMRGKAPPESGMGLRAGITPAYAGKSSFRRWPSSSSRDHPRVCGEKCCCRSHTSPAWGSPPRMRGKVLRTRQAACEVGITPAYAGKSGKRRRRKTLFWDHPRVCGEKHEAPHTSQLFSGSPPRMRGKVLRHPAC